MIAASDIEGRHSSMIRTFEPFEDATSFNLSEIEDEFSTVTIAPLSSDPWCYGRPPTVVDTQQRSLFHEMKKYSELKRPAKLPRMHSQDASFPSKKAENYYRQMRDGTFQMRWNERWNEAPDRKLHLCVLADEHARELIPEANLIEDQYVLVITLFPANANFQPWESSVESGGGAFAYTRIDPLHSLFDTSQINHLVLRVLHRFFRSHAYQLSQCYLEQMYIHLERFYRGEGWNSDWVDIGMTMTDTLLLPAYSNKSNHQYANQVYFMRNLGDALLSKGRFADAAVVWEEIGTHWSGLSNESGTQKQHLIWADAGVAYQCAVRYGDAERCFVNALWAAVHQHKVIGQNLHTFAADWNIHECDTQRSLPDTQLEIISLIRMYADWHIVQCLLKEGLVSEKDLPNMDSVDKRCFPILNGLALAAGVKWVWVPELFLLNKHASLQQVKSKFVATEHAAQRAILNALSFSGSDSSSLVTSFRNKLLSYQKPKRKGFKLHLTNPQFYVDQISTDRQSKKIRKSKGRDSIETEAPNLKDICSYCEELFPMDQLLLCPCRRVGYCGKTCRKSIQQ